MMCYAGRLLTDGYTEARSPLDGRAWATADMVAARQSAQRFADDGNPEWAAKMALHAAIIAERVS